jgi:alpha-glucuronidase
MIRPLVAVAAASSLLTGAGAAAVPSVSHVSLGHTLIPGPQGLKPAVDSVTGVTAEESENWSGYLRTGSAGSFTTSTASWTVPTVATTYNGYSSTWVGVDGAANGDDYLLQTGTESDVVSHKASYYAWYEVITPSDEAPEVRFGFKVSPGDAITASVTKGSGGDWTTKLTDKSTGSIGTHTTAYAGQGKSAEWIEEDTDVNNEISAAPDWKKVTFGDITLDGANPDLKAGDSLVIVDGYGTQEDTVSAPNSDDNGFTVKWKTTGSPTPI